MKSKDYIVISGFVAHTINFEIANKIRMNLMKPFPDYSGSIHIQYEDYRTFMRDTRMRTLSSIHTLWSFGKPKF